MDALNRAIDLAGGQEKLAGLVGGRQTRISEWKRRGNVPPEIVIAVSQAVGFRVTPHQLRPDLYPHPDDGLPTEMRARAAE